MTSLRERRRQMLRDEILRAARRLSSEKGFVAWSMDELATRVGISKPTLYSHFATKDDLTVAAASQSMQRLIDVIETRLADMSPLEGLLLLLRTTIQILFDEGLTPSRPITPEIMQLLRSREETYASMQRIDATISDLIQRGIAAGEIDPALDPATMVLAFHGLTHSLKAKTAMKMRAPDPEAMASTLVTFFARGVQNPGYAPAEVDAKEEADQEAEETEETEEAEQAGRRSFL